MPEHEIIVDAGAMGLCARGLLPFTLKLVASSSSSLLSSFQKQRGMESLDLKTGFDVITSSNTVSPSHHMANIGPCCIPDFFHLVSPPSSWSILSHSARSAPPSLLIVLLLGLFIHPCGTANPGHPTLQSTLAQEVHPWAS